MSAITIKVQVWAYKDFTAAEVAMWWARGWHRAGTCYMLKRHASQRELWPWKRTKEGEYRLQEKRCDRRMRSAVKRRNAAIRAEKTPLPSA